MDISDIQAARRAGVQAAQRHMVRFVLGVIVVIVIPTYTVLHFVGFDAALIIMLVGFVILGVASWYPPMRGRR